MKLPRRTFTVALALPAAVGVCAILLLVVAANAQPKTPLAPYVVTVVLDPNYLTAKSAILFDPLTNRILFEKNAQEQLPLASLTKLMSAAAILATTERTKRVAITPQDLMPEGDSRLIIGEEWSIFDLLTYGIVASSNDAMAAAAANAGENIIEAMNRTAGELGLTRTYFVNTTGLDEGAWGGAYGSARDVAVLTSVFLKEYPELLEATARDHVSISSPTHFLVATSTTRPLHSIPGFIGAKTGYTDLAGGNLVAVFDLDVGRPIIAAVLGSTREGRFEDVRIMIGAVRAQQ